MRNWIKKLLVVFVVALVAGSVFFPAISFAQTSDTEITYDQSPLPACGILPGSQGTYEGCFVRILYYVVLYPSSWLAATSGQIFDYFVAFTLNSESYDSSGFIEQGWRIIRDLVNVSFIFILLYVAIRQILNAQKAGTVQVITKVIIIAIVINFSLFMTRIIIDAGNILGRVFYEKIIVENDTESEINQYKTISSGLVAIVNPQKILTDDVFTKKYKTTAVDEATQQNTLGTLSEQGDISAGQNFEVGVGYLVFIILIASFINIIMIWIFISVSIFLISRTLGLWIMMIVSPIAFASVSIPFLKISKYSFSEWLAKTAQLSFMIVIFMFFLYLTIMFVEVAFDTMFNISTSAADLSTVHLIMSVIVPLAAVVFLLVTAKNQAKSMAGDFGDMVGKALKYGTVATLGAAGLTLGAAAGVGAAVGRQTVGRFGAKWAAKADTSTAMGRFRKRTGTYLSNAKYDARSINIPKPAKSILSAGKSGLSYATDGAVGAKDLNLTQLNTFGKPSDKSYVQRKEEYAKEKIDRAKMYKRDEGATMDNISGTYTYEEIDPTTGKVIKKTGAVSGSSSVSAAKSEKSKAQRELENKKAEIHQAQDYDAKKRELENLERTLEEKEKAYKELLDRKKAGEAINQSQIDAAKKDRDDAKNGDPNRNIIGVKQQKEKIKDIEKMYIQEANKVAEAEARIAAAERALAKKNAEILNNYADSVEKWAAFPDGMWTHRYDGNKDAVDEIRDMSNKEEKKSEKK